MPKEVELPDGTVAEFPDEMDDSAIEAVLKRQFSTGAPGPLPVGEEDLEFERRQQEGGGGVRGALRRGMQTDISPLRPLLRTIPGANLLAEAGTAERGLEYAPAIGGTVGALGGPVGAAAGAGLGEAARQGVRRAVGLPGAPGFTQRALGLEPESPGAAVAGIAAEAGGGALGGLLSKALGAAAGATRKHALSVLARMLKPRTQTQMADAPRLAQRVIEEGIAPPLSGRTGQLARAERALGGATGERAALEAGLAEAPVPGTPVLEAITQEQAKLATLPGTGRTTVRAGEKVAEDVLDLMAKAEQQGLRGGQVPLKGAVEQKRALDELLSTYYEGGRTVAPSAARQHYSKAAADAWRRAISDQFPDLGRANLRESELITITKLLREASERAFATGTPGQTAAELGGFATGRTGLGAVAGLRAMFQNPRYASLSSAGQRALANVLQGGADTAQLWVRMADYFNVPNETKTDIRKRAEARNQVLSSIPGTR